jgi:NAD+ kinase
MKLAFVASNTKSARAAASELAARYGQVDTDKADVIVALGGDGHMLQMLHNSLASGIAIYGMNRGSIGFMMNAYRVEGLPERVAQALPEIVRPLEMTAVLDSGKVLRAMAFNEVSILRQSYQAAKLRVTIDTKERLNELVCDGVMVATPIGSTAYNLSAHGPILPVDAPLLALTPVSPFRPRRWRGALLPNKARVVFEVLEPEKRPVNAVADHTEVKTVRSVEVRQRQDVQARILFDESHSWEERILTEQFRY